MDNEVIKDAVICLGLMVENEEDVDRVIELELHAACLRMRKAILGKIIQRMKSEKEVEIAKASR